MSNQIRKAGVIAGVALTIPAVVTFYIQIVHAYVQSIVVEVIQALLQH